MIESQQIHKILNEGFESFAHVSVRTFTVEALAKRLAMSKKTIYKYFPTKEKLIQSIIHHIFKKVNGVFSTVMKEEPNPAVQFVKIMENIAKFSGRTPINHLAELKSHYPEIWKEVESFRLNHQEEFYIILNEAQEKGQAREDINMRTTSIVYINIINTIFQPEFFLKNDLPIRDTIHDFIHIVARGIFNENGLKAINHYYEKNKK